MADGGLRRGQAAPGTTDTGPHCLNIRLEREVPPVLHGKGTHSDFIFQGPSLPRYPPTTPISEEEIKAFCRRCWQTQGRGSGEGGLPRTLCPQLTLWRWPGLQPGSLLLRHRGWGLLWKRQARNVASRDQAKETARTPRGELQGPSNRRKRLQSTSQGLRRSLGWPTGLAGLRCRHPGQVNVESPGADIFPWGPRDSPCMRLGEDWVIPGAGVGWFGNGNSTLPKGSRLFRGQGLLGV